MKNKQGSHVGMILSFVVFITFLVFLFAILQPMFNEKKEKSTVLNYISNNIEGLLDEKMTVVTIEITNYAWNIDGYNCFTFDSYLSGNFTFVKNITDDTQKYISLPLLAPTTIQVEPDDVEETQFKIYYSNEVFIPKEISSKTTCAQLGSGDYEIKSVREEEHPFFTKALKLGLNVSNSEEPHKELGKKLNVPAGTEFSIQIINETGTVVLGEGINLSTEVYSQEIPIEYVDIYANVRQGRIRVGVA